MDNMKIKIIETPIKAKMTPMYSNFYSFVNSKEASNNAKNLAIHLINTPEHATKESARRMLNNWIFPWKEQLTSIEKEVWEIQINTLIIRFKNIEESNIDVEDF